MNKHIEQIRARREMLVMRVDLQRFDLALQTESYKKPFSYVDRGIAVARYAREHPITLTLALVAIAAIGRNRIGQVMSLGVSAWRAYRLFTKLTTRQPTRL